MRQPTPAATETAPATEFPFDTVEIGAIAAAHPTMTREQRTALALLDPTQTGPWRGITWNVIAVQAAQRVFNPELMDQNVLGTCGPAAVLHGDASVDPVHFALQVVSIFTEGAVGGEALNPELLGHGPPGTMPAVDWMLQSAAQDVLNLWYDFEGTPSETSAMGTGDSAIESALVRFGGAVAATSWGCRWWGEIDAARRAGDLIQRHGNDVIVLMHVDAALLQDENAEPQGENHTIRLLSTVEINDVESWFTVFTWASRRDVRMTTEHFKKMVFGFTAGARRSGIEL